MITVALLAKVALAAMVWGVINLLCVEMFVGTCIVFEMLCRWVHIALMRARARKTVKPPEKRWPRPVPPPDV